MVTTTVSGRIGKVSERLKKVSEEVSEEVIKETVEFDVLGDVLETLRFRGSIFFRSELAALFWKG